MEFGGASLLFSVGPIVQRSHDSPPPPILYTKTSGEEASFKLEPGTLRSSCELSCWRSVAKCGVGMKWARLALGIPEEVLKTGSRAGPGPRLNSVRQTVSPGHRAAITLLRPQTPAQWGVAMITVNELCPSENHGGLPPFY